MLHYCATILCLGFSLGSFRRIDVVAQETVVDFAGINVLLHWPQAYLRGNQKLADEYPCSLPAASLTGEGGRGDDWYWRVEQQRMMESQSQPPVKSHTQEALAETSTICIFRSNARRCVSITLTLPFSLCTQSWLYPPVVPDKTESLREHQPLISSPLSSMGPSRF